ncbi:hypothetical protein RYZ26_17140 [Terasakiella sp. A23]|uniref:hypothetical protein n=1 Tax=Terasakiella sp. FCG-A23 TaxID=3080561 RepID=UPI002955CD69|nr:hypothetical protein [Terasakiella sp. A23]MDV7341337.1 hypothetical protein [Terasakiella sp. A23]
MDIRVCKNVDCQKPFEVSGLGEVAPGNKMREELHCPYCGTLYSRPMTSGFPRSHKLTDQQIADWKEKNNKAD